MKKKGSLNISIEAIVIVVIALTVLGLGITFVRSQFKGFSDISVQVQEDIKEKVMEEIRTGDKKLSFPGTELKGEASEAKVTGVGVKNTKDYEINFVLKFYVKIDGGTFEPFAAATDLEFTPPAKDEPASAAVNWDDTLQMLKQGESRFFPISLKLPDKQGNYLFKVEVELEDGEIYDSKSFFVKTS